MFDFSFGEMLVVGLVALVVLGPERLPKAARFIGLWVRRARAQWYSVKSELERELATEELRRGLADGHQVMRETEAHLRATDAEIRTAMTGTVNEINASPRAESLVLENPAQAKLEFLGDASENAPAAHSADFPGQDMHGH